jgi:hypothetical protein
MNTGQTMNHHANPLDSLISFCEKAIDSGKFELTKFHVLNAKNELQTLKQKLADSYQELFNCNQDLAQEIQNNSEYKIVAWAKTTDSGQLYDLRLQKNPYVDPKIMVPLYRHK